jgi:histidinol-phosphatase (PHP family)
VWERYFAALADAAASGMYDVMAHRGPRQEVRPPAHREPRAALYEDVAAAFADAGVAIEVSSAGLRKPCAEIYPGDRAPCGVLKRAGVPATTSSDAHSPDEVGSGLGLDAVMRGARPCGVS